VEDFLFKREAWHIGGNNLLQVQKYEKVQKYQEDICFFLAVFPCFCKFAVDKP